MKGYISYTKIYSLDTIKRIITLPPIILRIDYTLLTPVLITRVKPIIFGIDTLTYNASAYSVRDGSEVEEILKRLPGVEVDFNGNVVAQGKRVQKVLINGKEFFGGDLVLAIHNLPADVVDKLQIIDDYGDKARLTGVKSGEPSKVLNIVMKPNKRTGKFGRIQAGAGDYGKYVSNSFANSFKGDLQLSANGGFSNNSPVGPDFSHIAAVNYSDQWQQHLSGTFNLSTSEKEPHTSINTVQDNFYSGGQLHQTQKNQIIIHTTNDNLNGMLNYKPNSHSFLRLNTSAGLNQSSNMVAGEITSLQTGSGFLKSTSTQTSSKTQAAGKSVGSNVYFENSSEKSKQRLTLTAGFNYSKSRQTGDIQSNATILTDTSSSISKIEFFNTNNTSNWAANIGATYFIPLSSASFLELGYNTQTSHSETNFHTEIPGTTGGSPVTVDSLTQNQILHTFYQNAHIGYSIHLPKLDLSTTFDGQPGLMQGSTNGKGNNTSYGYFSLLPNIQGTWVASKSQKLNFNYSGQQNLPSIQQLAPYTNLTNPQYPIIGNPALRSSFTSTASLHYEKSSLEPTQFWGFGIGIGYTVTHHIIIENITHPHDTSQVIEKTSYLNAQQSNSFLANYHFSLPALCNRSIRINTDGNFSRSITPVATDNMIYNIKNWIWSQTLRLQLLVPDIVEADLEGNYSITSSSYPGSSSLSNIFKTSSLSLNTRHYFLKRWVINSEWSESFITKESSMTPVPISLKAAIQYDFLSHNKASIVVTGYNLFNNSSGVGQSSTQTSITQTKTQFTGRFYMCTFMLKFDRFKKQ